MSAVPHLAAFDVVLSIALGVGLAAAVGLRVFLPMLVVGLAAYSGHLTLSSGFAWVSTPAALLMLSVATLAEILAYYVPGIDNLLDTIATPAALIAGTVVAAAVMADLPPLVKWTTAVIAGGGAAGLTQTTTALLRAKSTLLTAGLANPVLATTEWAGALGASLLAIFAPLAALLLVALVGWVGLRLVRRFRRQASASAGGTAAPRPPG